MKIAVLSSLFLAGACLPAVAQAQAQLTGERVDGIGRLCIYRGAAGITTDSDQSRVIRVGIGENCPYFFPLVDNSRPPPPTAPLSNDTGSEHLSGCIYRQWNQVWTYQPPAGRPCPPTAGMIPAQPARPGQPH